MNDLKVELKDVTELDLPHLHKWANSPEACGDYDEPSFAFFSRITDKWKRGGYSTTWMIVSEGRAVGFANYVVHPWDDWIAVFGVIIGEPDARGKGIGTEAHRLLVPKIFAADSHVQKLEAYTDVENVAEQVVLKRVGFEQEGLLRRKNRLRGEFRDMYLYGFLRPETPTV